MSSKNVHLALLLLCSSLGCHSSCAGDEGQQESVVEAGPVLGAPRPIPLTRPGMRAVGMVSPPPRASSSASTDPTAGD